MDTSVILFNSLKHHLLYIKSFVNYSINNFNEEELKDILKKIGESQMDIYLGNLTIAEIEAEVLRHLNNNLILDFTAYNNFIDQQKGFHCITLSDDSVWVLRRGNELEKYVHIHPGRYSPNSIRVKAGILKTAISSVIFSFHKSKPIDMDLINESRVVLLDLSPVNKNILNENFLQLVNLLKL